MFSLSSKNKKGFTLVELLVVISCISILTAVAVPSYAIMQKNIGLSNTTQEVVNALRVAQNLAISSQGGADHKVVFQNDKYILDGTTEYELNNGAQIIQGGGTEIIFKKLTGTATTCVSSSCTPTDCTSTTCEIKIGFPDKQKIIHVDAVGRISF